jgi:hypothetical protein
LKLLDIQDNSQLQRLWLDLKRLEKLYISGNSGGKTPGITGEDIFKLNLPRLKEL